MIACLLVGGLLIFTGIYLVIGPMPNRAPVSAGGNTTTAQGVEVAAGSQFNTAGLAAIDVETREIDVSVYEAADRVVEIEMSDSAADRIIAWREGDTLYVREKEDSVSDDSWGSDEITLLIPKGGQGTLSITTTSGDIRIGGGFRGDGLTAELTTVSGDLSAIGARLAALSCVSSSGEVFVGLMNVYGPLSVRTTSGTVLFDDSSAEDSLVETESGTVSIWAFNAPSLTVKTVSGYMDLDIPGRETDYTVTVSTESGRIEGVQNRTGGQRNMTLSSVSGDIDVSFG